MIASAQAGYKVDLALIIHIILYIMLYMLNKCLVIKIYISGAVMPVGAVSREPSPVHPVQIKQSLSSGSLYTTTYCTTYDLRLNSEGDLSTQQSAFSVFCPESNLSISVQKLLDPGLTKHLQKVTDVNYDD